MVVNISVFPPTFLHHHHTVWAPTVQVLRIDFRKIHRSSVSTMISEQKLDPAFWAIRGPGYFLNNVWMTSKLMRQLSEHLSKLSCMYDPANFTVPLGNKEGFLNQTSNLVLGLSINWSQNLFQRKLLKKNPKYLKETEDVCIHD